MGPLYVPRLFCAIGLICICEVSKVTGFRHLNLRSQISDPFLPRECQHRAIFLRVGIINAAWASEPD